MVSAVIDPAQALAPWRVAQASVRGAAHETNGQPNQDAVLTRDSAAGVVLAAVSDGHGGARHFRSGDGSRIAVQASAAVMTALAPRVDALEAPRAAQLVADELPRRVLDAWRAAVHADLAARPLTEEELSALTDAEGPQSGAALLAEPVLAYGATLLMLAITERAVVLAQLGDGDVLAVDARGQTHRPLPPDPSLVGNFTTSLCLPDATSAFRTTVLARERCAARVFLLSTDGYANAFRSDDDFLLVGRDFADMITASGLEAVARELPAILADASKNGSGDDVTLAVVARVDRAATGAPIAPIAPGSVPGTSALRADIARLERSNRRLKSGLLALLIAALALALVGYVFEQQGRSAKPPPDPAAVTPPASRDLAPTLSPAPQPARTRRDDNAPRTTSDR